MRRLLTTLMTLCLCAGMAWADDSESLYVYRNDGSFNYFLTSQLDSVVYSNVDMTGRRCDEPVVQEFWAAGEATRIPLSAIDSIRFVSPEENLWLIDPVHYQYPEPDATYNPNILLDCIETVELLSVDTTTMMASLRFKDQAPLLYKGAILYIPDGESCYFLRVLEAYQQGNEAQVHFVVPAIQELIYNLRVATGNLSDEPSSSKQKTKGGRRNIRIEKAVDFVYTKSGLSMSVLSAFKINVDAITLAAKCSVLLDVSGPSYSNGRVSIADLNEFKADFDGSLTVDCSAEFTPTVGLKANEDWDWPLPSYNVIVPLKLPLIPVPIPLNAEIGMKGNVEVSLQGGNYSASLPFTISGGVNFGVSRTKAGGTKPYGKVRYDFKKQEPKVKYDPEVQVGLELAPFYPEIGLTIARIPALSASVAFKPALKYNASSIALGGQEVFQHQLDFTNTLDAGVSVEIVKDFLDYDASLLSVELKKCTLWKDPAVVQDLDSLRHDFMVRNAKTKRTVKVTGKARENTEGELVDKPISGERKVEIRTKSRLVDPKNKRAPEVLNNPLYKGDAVDEKGFFEWANEYQVTDPETSTIKPIYEVQTPSGIDTKQVIVVRDPKTGVVVDSTEITPITAIKNFDIELRDLDIRPNEEYDTIYTKVKVREYGDVIEEETRRVSVYRCNIPGHGWHTDVGSITATYKNGVAKAVHHSQSHTGDNCALESSTDTYDVLAGVSQLYARDRTNILNTYLPEGQKDPKMNASQFIDALRWMGDMGITKGKDYTFEEADYRGITCTKFTEDSAPDSPMYYWLNIMLASHNPVIDGHIESWDTESLIIYPDTIDADSGEGEGGGIVVIAPGGKSTNFGDGNAPEAHVTASDKPNLPANFGEEGSGEGGEGGGGGSSAIDSSLGAAEWTNIWKPGIYEMRVEDDPEEEDMCLVIAVSDDGWTYYIPNAFDHDGENQKVGDELFYDYEGYTTHMPCNFKWCDRGSTTYHYVENPQTGEGEVREFHFGSRAAMCDMMDENGMYGFADFKILSAYIKPEYLTRIADAGNHEQTYKTIVSRYKK